MAKVSRKSEISRKGESSKNDIISDLPENITELILTKLPIRDAVRTSILCSKWRYKWTTLTQLVFDEKCVNRYRSKKIVNFITRFLFLHDGPIQKFILSTSYLKMSPDIDQWLLFLSRKNIEVLTIDVEDPESSPPDRAPSCLFSCQKLTSLTLSVYEVEPPRNFKGFPCLKYLNLAYVTGSADVIQHLISSCPILECSKISKAGNLPLTIRAPKLKHLTLAGYFADIYLEYTPLLVALTMVFSEKILKDIVLQNGPTTYNCLKFIRLERLNLKEVIEMLYVLEFLLHSPNLQELHISVYTRSATFGTADREFWEKNFPIDFTFNQLKTVKISGVNHENDMEFLKFVLGRSPELKLITVSPRTHVYCGQMNMANQVLHFERASAKADIVFCDDGV